MINRVFADEVDRRSVRERLVNECGNSVPFHARSSPEEMDRIRFSVIRLSEGDMKKLDDAVKLANIDWRDLLMMAGFGYDVEAHNQWYRETVGETE